MPKPPSTLTTSIHRQYARPITRPVIDLPATSSMANARLKSSVDPAPFETTRPRPRQIHKEIGRIFQNIVSWLISMFIFRNPWVGRTNSYKGMWISLVLGRDFSFSLSYWVKPIWILPKKTKICTSLGNEFGVQTYLQGGFSKYLSSLWSPKGKTLIFFLHKRKFSRLV